eukprot:8878336-Pyramimonas_sp.AAC.1
MGHRRAGAQVWAPSARDSAQQALPNGRRAASDARRCASPLAATGHEGSGPNQWAKTAGESDGEGGGWMRGRRREDANARAGL